jgi:hypothetical protein
MQNYAEILENFKCLLCDSFALMPERGNLDGSLIIEPENNFFVGREINIYNNDYYVANNSSQDYYPEYDGSIFDYLKKTTLRSNPPAELNFTCANCQNFKISTSFALDETQRITNIATEYFKYRHKNYQLFQFLRYAGSIHLLKELKTIFQANYFMEINPKELTEEIDRLETLAMFD